MRRTRAGMIKKLAGPASEENSRSGQSGRIGWLLVEMVPTVVFLDELGQGLPLFGRQHLSRVEQPLAEYLRPLIHQGRDLKA